MWVTAYRSIRSVPLTSMIVYFMFCAFFRLTISVVTRITERAFVRYLTTDGLGDNFIITFESLADLVRLQTRYVREKMNIHVPYKTGFERTF